MYKFWVLVSLFLNHFTLFLKLLGFDFSEALMARRNAILEQQRRSLRPDVALNHELRLPQEWTY